MKAILVCLLLLGFIQVQAQSGRQNTYVLEDGSTLGPGGLDSLNKAWGAGHVMLQHNTEDDAKGIMHVVRMTDEMLQQMLKTAMESQVKMAAMIGQPAPVFTLKDLQGKSWSLAALKGKVVVLNFWFTSCPPCIAEMPDLNELEAANKSKNVVFLAITYNDPAQVKKFLQSHTFHYNILPSSAEVDKLYSINAWPASFVIGKDGNVAMALASAPDLKSQLQQAIDKAL